VKRGFSRKGGVDLPESLNAYYLILFIGLFLLIYIVLLPEGQKEELVGQPSSGYYPSSGKPNYGGSYGPTQQEILFSQSIGELQPFGQKIYAKPLASVSLYTDQDKDEELLAKSLDVSGGFFSGTEKELIFKVSQDAPLDNVRLLFFLEKAEGSITISLNDREIFSGPLTSSQLPLQLPASSIRSVNHITFSVSGGFSRSSYVLRDVTLFKTYTLAHTTEQRTFVLSADDLQRFGHLSLFYIINCQTANEKGTLWIRLNSKVISQQQIVCDAGEVSHDFNRNDLHEGRNVLELSIDGGKYILERMLLEGDIDAGKAPGYSFSVPTGSGSVFMELQLGADNRRKVATVLVNGYPLYLDTYGDHFSFDISSYVVPGQNNLRIIAETAFDVASLDVFLA